MQRAVKSNWWQMRGTMICYATCANEGWNTVQYSFVMQFVQIKSNLCRWRVELSTMIKEWVQMRLIHAVELMKCAMLNCHGMHASFAGQ